MILRIRNLEFDIDFDKNDFWTLEIYNPLFLREVFESLSAEITDESRIHRLLDGENDISENLIFIANPFESVSVMTIFAKKLRKYLLDNFRNLEDEADFAQLSVKFENFAEKITQNIDISLDFDDLTFEKFLKIANFHLHETSKMGSTKRAIYDILDLTSELSPDSVICFLNLKHFLTDKEFKDILEYASSKELKLVFLESSFCNFYSETEKVIIVDDDLYACERSFQYSHDTI